jgi:hypothetical protein
VRRKVCPYLIILLPPQNHRSSRMSPLGLTSLKRKNLPIVVTLGGIGSCYATLALNLIAFFLATNCAIIGITLPRCRQLRDYLRERERRSKQLNTY